MSERTKPHPKNVDGSFYVADGCCTACGVPETAAPDLFAYDVEQHCFVKRQPATPAETDRMLRAVRGAELDCIRYRGVDPEILQRIRELGSPHVCDFGSREDAPPMIRNQVTFSTPGRFGDSYELCEAFRAYFLNAAVHHQATPVQMEGASAAFALAWYGRHFHRVVLRRLNDQTWLAHHQGNLGLRLAARLVERRNRRGRQVVPRQRPWAAPAVASNTLVGQR